MKRSRPKAVPFSLALFVLGLLLFVVSSNLDPKTGEPFVKMLPGHERVTVQVVRIGAPVAGGVDMIGPILGLVIPAISLAYLALAVISYRRIRWARWPYMLLAGAWAMIHAQRIVGPWSAFSVAAAVATLIAPALLLFGPGAKWYHDRNDDAL